MTPSDQDSNDWQITVLALARVKGLFHSAIDWLKIYFKNSRYVPLDSDPRAMAVKQMAVKQCVLSESYRTHCRQTFSWQSSWWWRLLRILFLATQWIICYWILHGERIHVWCDEGQIMKVIDVKKQAWAKNSFYSLISFTRPHEKPWKRKHSSNCFVSQHFFTWGWDPKPIDFDLQCKEESDC